MKYSFLRTLIKGEQHFTLNCKPGNYAQLCSLWQAEAKGKTNRSFQGTKVPVNYLLADSRKCSLQEQYPRKVDSLSTVHVPVLLTLNSTEILRNQSQLLVLVLLALLVFKKRRWPVPSFCLCVFLPSCRVQSTQPRTGTVLLIIEQKCRIL